jgi:hypothetical protein
MATVVFFQSEFTLSAVQRAELASYLRDAFPAAVASKVTRLELSRQGSEGVKAILREEGTVTADQFLGLKQQRQQLHIVPGSIAGGNVDVVRKQVSNGAVPPGEDGTLVALRDLVQSLFGLTAAQARNLHRVSFVRELGQSEVKAQASYRREVTAQEWLDGIAANECYADLHPSPVLE